MTQELDDHGPNHAYYDVALDGQWNKVVHADTGGIGEYDPDAPSPGSSLIFLTQLVTALCDASLEAVTPNAIARMKTRCKNT